jgi:hypothetical protein
MNCQGFENTWNRLLDAETASRLLEESETDIASSDRAEWERAAHSHAQICPRCRQAGVRNETLREAIRSWNRRQLGGPAPDLADRIVAGACPMAQRPRHLARALIPVAACTLAAAAVLVLAIFPVHWSFERRPDGRAGHRSAQPSGEGGGPEPTRQADARLLSHALADATEATWDLARTTSEPAARLGRQVLEAATQGTDPAVLVLLSASTDRKPGSSLAALPSVLQDFPESASASWLQEVGNGLAAGVRPLSTTARQAFGFLRTPSMEKVGVPNTSPSSKGA